MIQEIDILLEDLDNRHLRIASQLMKTYASQVQELFSRPDTTDPSPDQPPSR